MIKHYRLLMVCLFISFFAIGCDRKGTEYVPPPINLPDNWQTEISLPVDETDRRWWEAFEDPTLNAIVLRVLENSPGIHEAYHRFGAYVELFWQSKANRAPQINLNAGYVTAEAPAGGILFQQASLANFFKSQNITINRNYRFFYFGPSMAWEVDIFGRLYDDMMASYSDTEVYLEKLKGIQLSLTTEAARHYIQIRSILNQLAVKEHLARTYETRYEAFSELLRLNKTTLDNQEELKIKIHENNKYILDLRKEFENHKFSLLTLMGESEWPCDIDLNNCGKIPLPAYAIDPGIPSDLLIQRPDVREADRELAAATYRVGKAKAEELPSFVILGFAAGVSKQIADLFLNKNFTDFLDPGFSYPIFDAGRRRAVVREHQARVEAAIARYQKTMLTAVEEVQISLYNLKNDQEKLNESQSILTESSKTFERKQLLYKHGQIDLVTLSASQDSFFQKEIELLQIETDVALDSVTLNKALGGWNER